MNQPVNLRVNIIQLVNRSPSRVERLAPIAGGEGESASAREGERGEEGGGGRGEGDGGGKRGKGRECVRD